MLHANTCPTCTDKVGRDPNTSVKEIVFSPLYILAYFVKDKVSISAWIYLWAFYFGPLIYISVFVPVPYCLDDCGFVVEPEVRQVDSSSSILLSQDCFSHSRFFFFYISIQIVKLFVLLLWKILLVAWWGLHWIYRLISIVYSFSLYWFFWSMNTVCFSIYLPPLWFHSPVFYSFLYIGLLLL